MSAPFKACIWRGMELAFLEDFDNLVVAVKWAKQQIAIDSRAGYVGTSATVAPKQAEC